MVTLNDYLVYCRFSSIYVVSIAVNLAMKEMVYFKDRTRYEVIVNSEF